eukprot:8092326-Pyramimonas_sp.AAC.1
MDQTAKAESSAAKAAAVETEDKTAEDVSSDRHGGNERPEIPAASIPKQTDGYSSSEESPQPRGSDAAAVILRSPREISKTHFTGRQTRRALRKENKSFTSGIVMWLTGRKRPNAPRM